MIRLATQDKPFYSSDFKTKLLQIKETGFDGFEADGAMLLNQFDELKAAVKETGVPVTSVCGGYRGWIGDFIEYRRQTAIEDIKIILERAGELGAKGIVVPAAWGMFSLRLPPMTPPRPVEADKGVLIDSLSQFEDVCKKSGTVVYLEPLNRYEDHMLNTLDAAATVIQDGHLEHVKIMADFFHMSIEEQDIKKSLIKWADLIGHVHIADSHRYQPGDGHTDFVHGFEGLKEIGFDGIMAFECRVLGEDQENLYKQSVGYIRDCMKKARL
ncbi:MAG: sugar phosphate isomerase/epimerase [Lachnospiraceae bacterium]|nr:sugar phosphate isomerase/epimerase [Lachnospiraceae bacterium]